MRTRLVTDGVGAITGGGPMAFEELKERHAAMWGSAPFERVAGTLADMHERVVETMVGGEGATWLDVGCGTGELAFMAAATGADVTACDLAPESRRDGPPAGGRAWARDPVRGRRRRGAPVRRRELRHRHVVDRRDLRAQPRCRRLRARTRVPPRRTTRDDRLDQGRGRRRQVLRDHRLVRPASPARCRDPVRVG